MGKRCSSLPLGFSREDPGPNIFATHTDERQQAWSAEGDRDFQARVQNVLLLQHQQKQHHRFVTGPPCKAATLYTAAPLPTATASQLQTSAACMQDLPEQTLWSKQRFAPDLLVQALGVEPEQRDDAAPKPFNMARTRSHTFSQTAMQQMSEHAQSNMPYMTC